jgi:hypothetical protein
MGPNLPLSEMMESCSCFPHVVKCQPSHHNSVIIKKAIILNVIHNILYGSWHMDNISSFQESGEIMLNVTTESNFARLVRWVPTSGAETSYPLTLD